MTKQVLKALAKAILYLIQATERPIAEVVLPQVIPYSFYGVEFRAVGR
jgi:carotenoid cleavage dioxygenase-like enzyme